MKHLIYDHIDGSFRVRKDIQNIFYVHTESTGTLDPPPDPTGNEPTGLPNLISSFVYNGAGTCYEGLNNGSISFDWSDYNNTENAVTGYVIQRVANALHPTGSYQFPDFVIYDSFGNLLDSEENPLYPFYDPCDIVNPPPPQYDYYLNTCIVPSSISEISITGWACGYYSFRIAAINSVGTGAYAASSNNDYLFDLWTSVGEQGIYNISVGATITANYKYNFPQDCKPYLQQIEAKLFKSNGTYVSNSLSYTNRGSISLTRPGNNPNGGWYFITVTETFTDYSSSCTVERKGCLNNYFWIPGN